MNTVAILIAIPSTVSTLLCALTGIRALFAEQVFNIADLYRRDWWFWFKVLTIGGYILYALLLLCQRVI